METIIDTAGVLVLAYGLGFAGMAVWTHAYLHRKRWMGFVFKAIVGSLLGLEALVILVRHFGGSWGDVWLGVGIVAGVLVMCVGLVKVFDR